MKECALSVLKVGFYPHQYPKFSAASKILWVHKEPINKIDSIAPQQMSDDLAAFYLCATFSFSLFISLQNDMNSTEESKGHF